MFSDENRRDFQRGIDPQAGKMKRQEDRLNLRRQIREGHLNKRRKELTEKGEATEDRHDRHMPITAETHYSSTPSIVNVFGAPVPSWVRVENLGDFASKVKSQNLDSVLEGVEAIRQLLSIEEKPPILQVFQTGIVPCLIDILTKKIVFKDPAKKTPDELKKCKLQFEASWALTNIASGDREFTQKLVDMHCIDAFFGLLKNTTDEETADQAIWGLGNIVGDCTALRDKALENGILEYIIEHLDNFPSLVKRNAVWTLSNFCRGKPSPDWKKVSKMLKPLANLIEKMEDYDAMADVLWSFSFLSEDRDEGKSKMADNDLPPGFNIDGVIQTGIVKHVINIVKFASKMGEDAWNTIAQMKTQAIRDGKTLDDKAIPPEVRRAMTISNLLIAPCVRIMGNIVSGSNEQTQEVLDAGFFDVIEICIDHQLKTIKKESCWALSNVVAGNKEQLNEFFTRENLIKKVVRLCTHPDINVCKEAGWCLSNAVCSSTLPQLMLLVDAGFIEAMVTLLHMEAETVVLMAMDALQFCLISYNRLSKQDDYSFNSLVFRMEKANGLDALEQIQANEKFSNDCYQNATTFVYNFWPDDYDAKSGEDIEENENENENEIDFGMEDASSNDQYQF